MASSHLEHTLLPKILALPVFSSDPMSSVAYATEEIMIVLLAASSSGKGYVFPISIAIVALLVLVTISYEQTIHAYPGGGGAYIVARDNLGEFPSQIAGAALLIDYSGNDSYEAKFFGQGAAAFGIGALVDFAGCAAVISHDRWFLDRVATHILAFEGDSQVTWFEGSFEEYEQWVRETRGEEALEPHRITYKPLVRPGA